VLWASLFLGAGLLVVLLLRLKGRKPRTLESWLFISLVLLLVGGVSLGVTGSAVAFVFTPLLNLLGFPSTALRTSWLGAMALSFLCPPGLTVSHALAGLRRTQYGLIFALSFFVYCLLASVVVYFIVERI
jgi:uncharacterized membrane protein